MWKMTDKEIVGVYLDGLCKIFNGFKKDAVLWSRVYRNEYATPLYEKSYLTIMPPLKSSVRGLYLSGTFQSYPVNDYNNVVRLAKEVVEEIGKTQK